VIDFILHINEHLEVMAREYGTLLYAILFLIIFVETGLVVMPFLPGDSLLFAAGALCANEATGLSLAILIPLLTVAAIAGDNLNYAAGRYLGLRATNIRIGGRRLVKQEYIDRTHVFFEKHGTKAIIMARFVPIVRTFTPFVAGLGRMDYKGKFLPFDIFGGILWITSMSVSGYFFGSLPWVKEHFEAVVLIIIFLSILPMIISVIRARLKR
jgi:membrane-associated protein